MKVSEEEVENGKLSLIVVNIRSMLIKRKYYHIFLLMV